MKSQDTPGPASCGVCGSKTGDDGLLCRAHTVRLAGELREIPGLLLELDVTIWRGDRVTVGGDIGRSAERPLAWNEHASEKRAVLIDTLLAWEIEVIALTNHGYVAKTVAALRMDETAGTAYDELVDAVRGVRRAIDRPDMATRFYAGPCPEVLDVPRETTPDGTLSAVTTAPCTGEVWAFIPTESDVPATLRCRSCEGRWGTAQWLRVGQRMIARMAELRRAA
jgi:hypothetical protein